MIETEMAGLVSQLDILVKDLEEDEEKAGIDEVGDYLCGMRDALGVVASTIRAGFAADEVRRFIEAELARSIVEEAGKRDRRKGSKGESKPDSEKHRRRRRVFCRRRTTTKERKNEGFHDQGQTDQQ